MKLHILMHNLRGLNEPSSGIKHNLFLRSVTPRVDVLLFQEHKLRGAKLEHIGQRLMSWCNGWVLEAEPGYRNWLNPSGVGKGGVGILLVSKYVRLVKASGSLMNNRVIWIKLEGVEGGNLGIACVYAPNIASQRNALWLEMATSLPKDCSWVIGGDFNMTERPEDKSHDCGRNISDAERISWSSFLEALQIHDSFQNQGGIRFSWDNQQEGQERRVARLDRIYTPKNRGDDFKPLSYSISGNSLGSDHALVKVELCIGIEEKRPTVFKWNASYLKDSSLLGRMKEKWLSLPHNMSFFGKLRHIARVYRWFSKEKAMAFKEEEEDTKMKLERATEALHHNLYNVES